MGKKQSKLEWVIIAVLVILLGSTLYGVVSGNT